MSIVGNNYWLTLSTRELRSLWGSSLQNVANNRLHPKASSTEGDGTGSSRRSSDAYGGSNLGRWLVYGSRDVLLLWGFLGLGNNFIGAGGNLES